MRRELFDLMEGETFRLVNYDITTHEYQFSRPDDGEWDWEDRYWSVTLVGDLFINGKLVQEWRDKGFVTDVRVDSIRAEERGAVIEVTHIEG